MSLSKGCPVCGHRFTRTDKWRFSSWWGRRRVSGCPGCGVMLTWAPWMWRVGNASAAVVLGMSLAYLFLREVLPVTAVWWLVDVSAAGLVLFSVYRRHLIQAPTDEGPGRFQPYS